MEPEKTPTEATYRAVYTEPTLSRAVRLFVWRGVIRWRGWFWLAAIALHRCLGDAGILDDIPGAEPVHYPAGHESFGGSAGFPALPIAAER